MDANQSASQNGYRVEIGQESYFCSTQEQAQAIHDAMEALFGKESSVKPSYRNKQKAGEKVKRRFLKP